MAAETSDSCTITLPDGRTLGYAIYGTNNEDPSTPTVLYFHGFPGSRLEAAMAAPHAKEHGIRIIALDRPGMGLSSFQKGRRLTDWPADVEALLQHLRLDKVHILGVSGGGPYALACARYIPHRLLRVGIVCGAYPFSLGTEGMPMATWVMVRANSSGWLTTPMAFFFDAMFGKAARDTEHPERLEQVFLKEMAGRPEQDVRCANDPVIRNSVLAAMREAFKQGAYGNAWEGGLYGGDWGFRLEDIDLKSITLWHGKLDGQIPVQMAEKAARMIPGATLKINDDEAHFSMAVLHIGEIIASLLSGVIE
jgi:pimeloyl-ACP methyl ester carboxylesterase